MKPAGVKYIILSFFFATNIYSQEARQPTAAEKETITKNGQFILLQVPAGFEKMKKGDALDFFGNSLWESSIKLLPGHTSPVAQNIFYIKEKNGELVKSYSEPLPFNVETCLNILNPLLKQNAMVEVAPVRADSTVTTRSYRGKNAVIVITSDPNSPGSIVTIGKLYYYYTGVTAPVTVKTTSPPGKNNINMKPENSAAMNSGAAKVLEEKILKGLIKLYKSAASPAGSFAELKTGAPEKIYNTEVYTITGKLLLDSIQKADLYVTRASDAINGVAADIAAEAAPAYINAIQRMSKLAETPAELIIEKKTGLTRYSLFSKPLKMEVLSFLDFEYTGYSDRLICNALYSKQDSAAVSNNPSGVKTNSTYKNYTVLPPANEPLFINVIQLGISEIFREQFNLNSSFNTMRKGTPEKTDNAVVYDVLDQIRLPNIAVASLYVARNDKGTSGLIMNIDPAVTSYYIHAIKTMNIVSAGSGETATVTSEKNDNGETTYRYRSGILNITLMIIVDYPDPARKDDVMFLPVY